jgi:DNA-binding IclR family transcriptional regulator
MPRVGTGESVLARAVRILAAFSPEEPVLTVTQIAARSGLHVGTASRLAGELVRLGLLERDDDRRVRVGMRLWELGARAAPTRGLREAALPFLEDLHAVIGHHAQLGVREGTEVIFVERLSTPGAVINYSWVAGRLPLHVSSSGMVLLAAAPGDVLERVLAGPLRAYTDCSVTDPRRLRRVLADVRRQGYAYNPGHVHPEATGIAAPVRDGTGAVVAAVSVIVPNTATARSAIPVLRTTARAISRTLLSQ